MCARQILQALVFAALLACIPAAWALPADLVLAVAAGESDEQVAAVGKLVASEDPGVEAYFQALLDGEVQVSGGKRALIVKDQQAVDAATGAKVEPLPADLEDAIVNNRLRGTIASARSALKLASPDRAQRLAAVKALEDGARAEMLPLIAKALARETDAQIRKSLALVQASVQLKSDDAALRMTAVKALAHSDNPNTKMLLLGLL